MDNRLKEKNISRAKFMSILGWLTLIPLISKAAPEEKKDASEDQYDILLRSDGSTVKVKKGIIKNSKTIKSRIDNPTMLQWLKNKYRY